MLMIHTIRILSAVAAVGLMAGCDRSDTAASRDDGSTRASREPAVTASPTARDPNAPERLYATDNTNASLKDADNSGRNVRDRSDATLTPGDQGKGESDREITRNIRRALTTNDQFSTVAKNIKIITVNGKVTLRGPVKSQEEQQAILAAAQSVAGQGEVDNQLEVKAENQ